MYPRIERNSFNSNSNSIYRWAQRVLQQRRNGYAGHEKKSKSSDNPSTMTPAQSYSRSTFIPRAVVVVVVTVDEVVGNWGGG